MLGQGQTMTARPALDAASFSIPGRVAGKGRPRATVVGGFARMYTPEATRTAEDRVRDAWRAAGCPWLGDGPLCAEVTLYEQRPAGHWKRDGSLSALGERTPFATRKPDLDNAMKLILDSICGCAFRDDKQFVDVRIRREWLPTAGLPEHATVDMWVARVGQMELGQVAA